MSYLAHEVKKTAMSGYLNMFKKKIYGYSRIAQWDRPHKWVTRLNTRVPWVTLSTLKTDNTNAGGARHVLDLQDLKNREEEGCERKSSTHVIHAALQESHTRLCILFSDMTEEEKKSHIYLLKW